MSIDTVWVFGDSVSTPFVHVDPRDSFWGLTAQFVNATKIMNCSRLGNSFDSLAHLLVSMQKRYSWDNDLFLLCIPPLERITIFDDFKDTPYEGFNIPLATWESNKFDVIEHRGLISEKNFGSDKNLIIHVDRSWLEIQVMRHVFLISSWLTSNNAKHIIVNQNRSFDGETQWPPAVSLIDNLKNNKNCLLFSGTYRDINLGLYKPMDYDEYGWDGHHGINGNKHFSESSILPILHNIC
jgi:hypothetical protein